ncbi:recombinase family protein [Streptomyces lydicus]|uniref:recombinase family protein n=1 Tax=Streptomyces lydicus TaxID=47763 RepID=UPI003716DA86
MGVVLCSPFGEDGAGEVRVQVVEQEQDHGVLGYGFCQRRRIAASSQVTPLARVSGGKRFTGRRAWGDGSQQRVPGDREPPLFPAIAEMEAEAIRERVIGSHDYLRRNGRWGGGLAPYGYQAEPIPGGKGARLVEDPEAAETVREVAERVLARESYLSIAALLNKRGVPSPTNQRSINAGRPTDPKIVWTNKSVATIIGSERIRGRVEYRGEVVRDEDANAVLRGPELVDAETWRALQQEFARRERPDRRRTASAHPLLGVVFCSSCQERMYQGWATEKGRPDRRTYVCRSRARGRRCKSPSSVSAVAVDKYAEEQFLSKVGAWPVKVEVVEAGEDHRPQEIEELEQALDRLETDRYERGLFEGEDGSRRYERRHRALSRKVNRLKEQPYRPPTSRWVGTGRTYAEDWKSGDLIEHRRMLVDAGCRIEVRPAGRGKRDIRARLSFALGRHTEPTSAWEPMPEDAL